MKKSSHLSWEYAIEQAANAGNTKVLNRLNSIDCTYSSENWLDDFLFVTRQVVKYKRSLCGHTSYAPFIRKFRSFSPMERGGKIHSDYGLLPQLFRIVALILQRLDSIHDLLFVFLVGHAVPVIGGGENFYGSLAFF